MKTKSAWICMTVAIIAAAGLRGDEFASGGVETTVGPDTVRAFTNHLETATLTVAKTVYADILVVGGGGGGSGYGSTSLKLSGVLTDYYYCFEATGTGTARSEVRKVKTLGFPRGETSGWASVFTNGVYEVTTYTNATGGMFKLLEPGLVDILLVAGGGGGGACDTTQHGGGGRGSDGFAGGAVPAGGARENPSGEGVRRQECLDSAG